MQIIHLLNQRAPSLQPPAPARRLHCLLPVMCVTCPCPVGVGIQWVPLPHCAHPVAHDLLLSSGVHCSACVEAGQEPQHEREGVLHTSATHRSAHHMGGASPSPAAIGCDGHTDNQASQHRRCMLQRQELFAAKAVTCTHPAAEYATGRCSSCMFTATHPPQICQLQKS